MCQQKRAFGKDPSYCQLWWANPRMHEWRACQQILHRDNMDHQQSRQSVLALHSQHEHQKLLTQFGTPAKRQSDHACAKDYEDMSADPSPIWQLTWKWHHCRGKTQRPDHRKKLSYQIYPSYRKWHPKCRHFLSLLQWHLRLHSTQLKAQTQGHDHNKGVQKPASHHRQKAVQAVTIWAVH